MDDKEIIKNLITKLKEAEKLKGLNSNDPKFKNWHISVMNLMRVLPKKHSKHYRFFQKLTFTDTKYHRVKRAFDPADTERFNQDLDKVAGILKDLTKGKKESTQKKPEPGPKKEVAATSKGATPAKKGKSIPKKKTSAKSKK